LNGRIWERRRWWRKWDFSEDLSRVAFPWAGAGTFALCCWFPAFYCWVPLCGAVPGRVCMLKANEYTDVAGSKNK